MIVCVLISNDDYFYDDGGGRIVRDAVVFFLAARLHHPLSHETKATKKKKNCEMARSVIKFYLKSLSAVCFHYEKFTTFTVCQLQAGSRIKRKRNEVK